MSFLWEKVPAWRWIVALGCSSRGFMVAFAGVCVLVPWVVGQGVMSTTNVNNEQLQAELLKRGKDWDASRMGRVNKERLGQFLGEIQRKENTEDRYKAAQCREMLMGTPDARVWGGGGTSVRVQKQSEHEENSTNLLKSNRQLLVVDMGKRSSSIPTS